MSPSTGELEGLQIKVQSINNQTNLNKLLS